MITVFTGGTGGTKLVQGLQQVVSPEDLTVVVNTGDDVEWWGLHVSPDIDSVLYGVGGLLSTDRGWGVEGDSFRCLDRMKQLGQPGWFSLGDLDLATHLTRTALLRAGKTLSEATAELAAKFGIRCRVLPMSDDRVSTMLDTAKGTLSFQEYFVRERHQVEVHAVRFEGAEQARPAPGIIDSIESAEVVVFAPSNPVTSIGPILAVPGVRDALRRTKATIAAVSPIVGGAAVSGPAGALMEMSGWPCTAAGVAEAYKDFLDVLVVDEADRALGETTGGTVRFFIHQDHHAIHGRQTRPGGVHPRCLRRDARGQSLKGILLIPVKSLATAKQRLKRALDATQRSQLATAMLRDVMSAAAELRGRIDVALVTGDPRAKAMAAEFGFLVIEDTLNESETAAIEMATEWCGQRGYDTTIVVPGDIPLIEAAELHRVLDAAPEEGAVFVPAYDRRGSNCILRRPAAIIPLRFGNDSFLPHCEVMKNTGKELVILEMEGIGLDVDNPHELELLVERSGDTNAQRLLRSWGFGANEAGGWEAAAV